MDDRTKDTGKNAAGRDDAPAPWELGATPWEPPRASAPPPPPVAAPSTVSYSVSSAPLEPSVDFGIKDPTGVAKKVVLTLTAVGALLFVWLMFYELIPADIAAPTTYSTYVSPDKRFSIQTPTDWPVQSDPAAGDGDNDPLGRTLVRQGPVKVIILTDTVTDLKAKALVQSGAALPEEFTESPTKALHTLDEPTTAASFKGYSEQPYVSMDTNFGPAYVSEFTGQGGMFGWGGPVHGYRLSVADQTHTISVVFVCPEKSWLHLQPAFQHMIATLGPADGSTYAPDSDTNTPDNGGSSTGGGQAGSPAPAAGVYDPTGRYSGNGNDSSSGGAAGYGGSPSDGTDSQ